MEYSKVVRHIDNNPTVIICVSMIGIQMAYKNCCCRSYSCWLCCVRNKSLCYYIVYKIISFWWVAKISKFILKSPIR